MTQLDAPPEPEVPEQEPPRRTRPSRVRQVVVMLVGLLLVVVGGIAGVLGVLQHRVASQIEYIEDPFVSLTDRPTTEAPTAPSAEIVADPMNILLLGSDSRISAGDPSQWSYGAQRTDAIMLVHISGDRQSVQVMSIPRDSWVPIPGYGHNKINAAYSFGGPPLMIQTVEQLTGVRIDHFAIADFESFAQLTDELGGVEIDVGIGFSRDGITVEPGLQTLDGDEALAYVRERYGLPGGDFDRVKRQQNWIRAIMRAAFDQDMLSDPLSLTSFVETAASAVMVDDGFTIGAMRDLAISMRNVRSGDVTFLTVPINGTGWTPGGASIVVLNETAFARLMAAVADDTVVDYLANNDLNVLGPADSVR